MILSKAKAAQSNPLELKGEKKMSKPYERLCIGYFNKKSKKCKDCEIPFTCIETKEKQAKAAPIA